MLREGHIRRGRVDERPSEPKQDLTTLLTNVSKAAAFFHRGLRHLEALFNICAPDDLQILAMVVGKTEDASKPLSRKIFAAVYSSFRRTALAINLSNGAQASTFQTPNGVRV